MCPCRVRCALASTRLVTAGVLFLVLVLGPSPSTEAQAPGDAAAVQLSPGVLIDGARSVAYLMSPKGEIEAVSLSTGDPKWATPTAAKPLGVAGNRVVGQADRGRGARELTLVPLDSETGSPTRPAPIEIPLRADERASVDETSEGRFVARAQPVESKVHVLYRYTPAPTQGIAPAAAARLLPPPGARARAKDPAADPRVPRAPAAASTGRAFLVDLETGSADPVALDPADPDATAPPTPVARRPSVADRIPGVDGEQFLSADGAHIAVSERTGDDRVWEKYAQTVYETKTKKKLGQFKTHDAFVPFLAAAGRAFYYTPAYQRAGDGGAEPPALRAADLSTGDEIWRRPIRDTAHSPRKP